MARDASKRPDHRPVCSNSGCFKRTRSRTSVFCEACYYRNRRNGSLAYKVPTREITKSNGYLQTYAPQHPLASKVCSPRVYTHRMVLYDHIGPGNTECHWCRTPISWDNLHVDHLDDDKTNNVISNLVPSCLLCNTKRGQHKQIANKRMRYSVKAFGFDFCLMDWGRMAGISTAAILDRLNSGMTLEQALTKPRQVFGPQPSTVKRRDLKASLGKFLTEAANDDEARKVIRRFAELRSRRCL